MDRDDANVLRALSGRRAWIPGCQTAPAPETRGGRRRRAGWASAGDGFRTGGGLRCRGGAGYTRRSQHSRQ